MKMRHVLSALVCAAILSSAPAAAWAAQPLAERLPAQSLLYVGWAGQNPAFTDSVMGQLLQEPAVDAILAAVKKAIQEKIPPQGPQAFLLENGWRMGGIILRHPLAVSVVNLAVDQQGPPIPSGVLLIDLGKDRADFEQLFSGMLALAGKELPLADANCSGVAYKVFKPDPTVEIAFGYIKDLFFITLGEGLAEQVIKLSPETSLASNKHFADCFKTVGGENVQAAFYVDAAAILGKAETFFARAGGEDAPAKSKFARIATGLGVSKITALAGTMRVVDRGILSKVKIFSKAPHQGLLMLLSGGELSDADLAAVPDDADLVAALKLSPSAVYEELRRVLREFDPRVEATMLREVSKAENKLGIQLADDLLACLGDTWVLSSAASQGGFLTGTLLSVQVKDAAKLTAVAAKIEGFFRARLGDGEERNAVVIHSLKAGETEIHYVAVHTNIMPVAPAWAISKDRLYIALWPQVIQSALEGPSAKPLIKDPAFIAARARLAAKPSGLVYLNLPRLARQVYNFGLVGWTIAANALAHEAGIPARPDWLPPLNKIEKYLWPHMGAMSADADGITFEQYGSLPCLGATALPAVGVAAAVALPALAKTRHEARVVGTQVNLRNIGMAIQAYEIDTGKYPPDLDALVAKEMITPNVLVSPSSGKPAPKLVSGKLLGAVDFVYIMPIGERTPEQVVCFERPENNGNRGTWVLYSDGTVKWLNAANFPESMKKAMK